MRTIGTALLAASLMAAFGCGGGDSSSGSDAIRAQRHEAIIGWLRGFGPIREQMFRAAATWNKAVALQAKATRSISAHRTYGDRSDAAFRSASRQFRANADALIRLPSRDSRLNAISTRMVVNLRDMVDASFDTQADIPQRSNESFEHWSKKVDAQSEKTSRKFNEASAALNDQFAALADYFERAGLTKEELARAAPPYASSPPPR